MEKNIKIHKYISTGGLGDALIASLKIRQLPISQMEMIEWLHVESNEIVPVLVEEIFDHPSDSDVGFSVNSNVMVESIYDRDYIRSYQKGKWKEYTPISSGIDGKCPLKGNTEIVLTQPFRRPIKHLIYEYDICLQVSAGAKNNRRWHFDPYLAAKMLKNQGFRVCLVGNEPNCYEKWPDSYNFVGKMSLTNTLKVIDSSHLFVGLSGFLNYYACSRQIKNVHLIESEQHEARYYHPEWNNWTTGVKVGSLQELTPIFRRLK